MEQIEEIKSFADAQCFDSHSDIIKELNETKERCKVFIEQFNTFGDTMCPGDLEDLICQLRDSIEYHYRKVLELYSRWDSAHDVVNEIFDIETKGNMEK